MIKTLFKIISMALIIAACMAGYDIWNAKDTGKMPPPSSDRTAVVQQEGEGSSSENVRTNQQLTSGPSLEERKITQHEKSALKAIFLGVLPERSTWPQPLQKVYLAFNLEDVIDPLRERPDWVRLSGMSRDIPQAVLAIEDHDYYNHGAIAFESIIRAFLVNISAGEVVQGGSTITQQLVKNVFLSHEQTMGRKVEEMFLSLMLEQKYTKDEILEIYLNTTYFGAGTNGVQQAARRYFDKAPGSVTLAEAAVLAALPYAPSALNPLENPEGCKKRQQLVLQEMQRYAFISQTQYSEAKNTSVRLANGTNL